jgi:uncharacterized protein YcaQ
MPITPDTLRRYARTLFAPTTLPQAIAKLGFVQADPIRAPARAQDLTLRHRVRATAPATWSGATRAGARRGLLRQLRLPAARTHRADAPAHRPAPCGPRRAGRRRMAVLAFVRERGVVHPREVDAQFAHGKTRNWFGGNSNASTQLLDGMHYRGLLRVVRRDSGTRCYAARRARGRGPPDDPRALDALVDVMLAKYAPLPERSPGRADQPPARRRTAVGPFAPRRR